MQATQELPIRDMSPLLPPRALKAELPMTEVAHRTVVESRAAIRRILRREDHRLLVIVGPCSIHDPEAALEYASRLNALRQGLADLGIERKHNAAPEKDPAGLLQSREFGIGLSVHSRRGRGHRRGNGGETDA